MSHVGFPEQRQRQRTAPIGVTTTSLTTHSSDSIDTILTDIPSRNHHSDITATASEVLELI